MILVAFVFIIGVFETPDPADCEGDTVELEQRRVVY